MKNSNSVVWGWGFAPYPMALFRINLFGSLREKIKIVNIHVQIYQRSGTVRVRSIIVGSRQQYSVIKIKSKPIFLFFINSVNIFLALTVKMPGVSMKKSKLILKLVT